MLDDGELLVLLGAFGTLKMAKMLIRQDRYFGIITKFFVFRAKKET